LRLPKPKYSYSINCHSISATSPRYYRQSDFIFYDAQIGSAPLLKAVKTSGATLVYEYKNLHGIAIRPSSKTNIEDTIAYFKKINGVLSVEQDRLLKLQ
jgi:hypothetical protein